MEVSGACQPWTGGLDVRGYGYVHMGDVKAYAHRVAYEEAKGPIPDGLQLDHLCRNRACVNVEHLEPVTARVNTLRGIGPTADNARKTVCVRGHPLDGDVRITSHGHRVCRQCERERDRRRASRRRSIGGRHG